MRDSFLPFSPPSITEAEIDEVVAALRSGWITTGPRTAKFETEFASFVGAESALALSSGTAALHLGLLVAGVRPGQHVIVSPLTFCSAVHVVEHVGAVPVFADVDALTLNLDPSSIAAAIESHSSSVGAIMPVHLHGQPCDLDAIIHLAEGVGAAVIDDAAHALPASIGSTKIGSRRRTDVRVLTAFSFYATKNLTTGEGGMLTGPSELLSRARQLSLHGMDLDAWNRYGEAGKWGYDVTEAGFKYNMTDIQSAIGLVQLARLEQMHHRRQDIAAAYSEAFEQIDSLQPPTNRHGSGHAWHIYALRLHLAHLSIDRDQFIAELRARNIAASVHFIPVHTLSWYRDRYNLRALDFPVAFKEFQRMVSLPIHPGLTDSDVHDVINSVSDVARKFRR